jgi:hypothetical protein
MDYTTQNNTITTTDNQAVLVTKEKLELFAEELPTQHDLRPPLYTVGTLSTYGSTASSVSTVSTV